MTTKYRMKASGQIVTEKEYRAMYSEVFPEVLRPTDADPILESPAPACLPTQYAVKTGIKQDSLGNWIYDWDIVNKTQGQIDAEFKATVPLKVTMRQARKALLLVGKLDAVNAAINALPSPARELAKIEWEYSQEVQRAWPLVAQLIPALGMTEREMDELFIHGATL